MSRLHALENRLRSLLPSFKNLKLTSTKWTLDEALHQEPRDNENRGLRPESWVEALRNNAPNLSQERQKKEVEKGSQICIPSNIKAGIISVEKEGHKVAAIVLDQPRTMDCDVVLKYKRKIRRYTKELHSINDTAHQLEEAMAKALKEGDEYAESHQENMQIADLINTEPIQKLRVEIKTMERKLGALSVQKSKLAAKLTHAQNISDISQSNLEAKIRCLFEEHSFSEDERILNDGRTISELSFIPELNLPLPLIPRAPSPTPTEIQKRQTQQKIWDLSEKVQVLSSKVDDWSTYRSKKMEDYHQAFEAGETSDTQTIFDLKLLHESRTTLRNLIEAEADFTTAEKHAREIGVYIDDGEREEGFSDCDDDGYTISREEDMMYEGSLSWIHGWMGETPERDAEPDVGVEVGEVEVDEWDARVVEMGDSVSVREGCRAVGRRRERIDGYRRDWEGEEGREIGGELIE